MLKAAEAENRKFRAAAYDQLKYQYQSYGVSSQEEKYDLGNIGKNKQKTNDPMNLNELNDKLSEVTKGKQSR